MCKVKCNKRQAWVDSLYSKTKSGNLRMESEYEVDAYNCMKVKQCSAEHT